MEKVASKKGIEADSPSRLIDATIEELNGWQSKTPAQTYGTRFLSLLPRPDRGEGSSMLGISSQLLSTAAPRRLLHKKVVRL